MGQMFVTGCYNMIPKRSNCKWIHCTQKLLKWAFLLIMKMVANQWIYYLRCFIFQKFLVFVPPSSSLSTHTIYLVLILSQLKVSYIV